MSAQNFYTTAERTKSVETRIETIPVTAKKDTTRITLETVLMSMNAMTFIILCVRNKNPSA